MLLKDKVAIITGGASGIGKAISFLFAKEGARVVVCDINEEGACEVASSIIENAGQALPLRVDVSKKVDCQRAIDETVRRFEGISILVNNAGILQDAQLKDMDEAKWDAVLNVNFQGAVYLSFAVLPHMVQKNYGKIVNVASRAHLGNFGQSNYSTSKAALVGFTKGLALEYGKHNITINSVAPGITDTPLMRSAAGRARLLERAKAAPLQRIASPEELAAVILFLASDLSSFVTGQIINACGGRSLLPAALA